MGRGDDGYLGDSLVEAVLMMSAGAVGGLLTLAGSWAVLWGRIDVWTRAGWTRGPRP